MPREERRTDVTLPFRLDSPASFATLRTNNSEAESAMTMRMRSVVEGLAGPVDDAAWRLMFSPEQEHVNTTLSKGKSLFAARILSLGTLLVSPIVAKGTAINPVRFERVLDDVAVRVVGDHVQERLDYLDQQAKARPPHSEITAAVTSFRPTPEMLAQLRAEGRGPGTPFYVDALRALARDHNSGVSTAKSGEIATGEYDALLAQGTRISNGVSLLERHGDLSGLAPTLEAMTKKLRIPNGDIRKRELRKVGLDPVRFYIAPSYTLK